VTHRRTCPYLRRGEKLDGAWHGNAHFRREECRQISLRWNPKEGGGGKAKEPGGRTARSWVKVSLDKMLDPQERVGRSAMGKNLRASGALFLKHDVYQERGGSGGWLEGRDGEPGGKGCKCLERENTSADGLISR